MKKERRLQKKEKVKKFIPKINNKKIELSYLNECLDYNYKTGIFIWKERPAHHFNSGYTSAESSGKGWNTQFANKVAGTLSKESGYIFINIGGRIFRAHRLGYFMYHGFMPENGLDHKDRVRHHNWITNLRETTAQCNKRNCNIGKNNTSGITGVGFDKPRKKWAARIKVYYKQIPLGRFDNFDDAVMARWEAEIKYKFPNCNTSSYAYNHLKNKGLI